MKNMIFKKNIVSFYISVIMITIASSLPHSVLTVLLLKKKLKPFTDNDYSGYL